MSDDAGQRHGLTGRLPSAEALELTDAQQVLAAQLHEFAVPFARRAGYAAVDEHGRLIGPWNTQLHRPELATPFNQWVLADQTHSSLTEHVREVVILTVAVAWRSSYGVYAHVAAARTAGLSEAVIDAIMSEAPTASLTEPEAAAAAFTNELVHDHTIADATYRRAHHIFGRTGVIDLANLVAVYLATTAMLIAFDVPAP
jgi:4-carboxymuconolactone decarboxylase